MGRKRINKLDMEHVLVASGNQALATGTKVGATTALGILDAQLGILSVDHNGSTPYGTFLTAGNTTANSKAIAIVQGTPKSGAIQTVDAWEVGDKGTVETSKIVAGKIRSVTTKKCTLPVYSVEYFTAFPTPLSLSDYLYQTTLDSVRRDRDFGDNDELVTATFTTPDYTALPLILNTTDHLLKNLLYKVNLQSQFSASADYSSRKDPVIVLGINSAGGTGQVIGTIVAGTVIPVQTDGTNVTNLVADTALVNTLTQAVAAGLSATATIEVINLTTAGTVAAGAGTIGINSFLTIGFDDPKATAFDNIKFTKVRTITTLGDTFLDSVAPTKTVLTYPVEGSGKGTDWVIENDNRARLTVHTMQNQPHGDYFNQGVSYVNPALSYTSTIIDYYDEEEQMDLVSQQPKQAILLLTCAVTNPTANVNTGYTIATSDAATVAALNASLGVWLTSERLMSGHEILGDAVAGTYFL